MKRADIKQGEIYAYQRSRYDSPKECLFLTPLTPDNLYHANRYRKPAEPRYQRAENSTKPTKSYVYGNTGWLVAIGHNVIHASLADALSPEERPTERGFHYEILLTPTHITGIYTEVVEAERLKHEAERAARKAAQETNEATSHKFLLLQTQLLSAGLDIDLAGVQGSVWRDSENNRKFSPPRAFIMTYDQATDLADLIDAMSKHIKHLEG